MTEIESLLPHRAPMVLLDELVSAAERSITCAVTVAPPLLFRNPDGSLPAWVGIELMAQTVAAWAGYWNRARGEPPRIAFLLSCRRYDSLLDHYPAGSRLLIHANELLQDGSMGVFECRIELDGETVAQARLNTYQPSADELQRLLQEGQS